jgi:hypothetical protein
VWHIEEALVLGAEPVLSSHDCGEDERHQDLSSHGLCAVCARNALAGVAPESAPSVQPHRNDPLSIVLSAPTESRDSYNPSLHKRGPPVS